jgi:hypothetical protein
MILLIVSERGNMMALYEDLPNGADDCLKKLQTENLIERTNEWGLDNVWRLKLESKIAADSDYLVTKMYNLESFAKEKQTICLHFTAGGSARGHFDYLAKTRYNDYVKEHNVPPGFLNCTPFWINWDGTIYQYYHPDYWAHNSSTNTYNHQRNIAIEIVNYGPLVTGPDANILYFENKDGKFPYCNKETQTEAYYDLAEKPLNGWTETSYRDYRYFAKFTDEQYISLKNLLHALCNRYSIKYEFLPKNIRFLHASEFWDTTKGYFERKEDKKIGYYYPPDENFNGIFSHVNSAGRNANGKWEKWDIGPAFEWDRIIQPPLYYPFEVGKTSTPTTQWYHNTELRGEGGYYPVGRNQRVHSGVHLFSSSGTQAIRAAAPGYVAAWRFYTRLENYTQENTRKALKMRHGKPGSFVLLRHDFKTKEGEGVLYDKIC